MTGLDMLGAENAVVGFDYMNLLKGVAGGMQGAGGLMSGGGAAPGGAAGGGAAAAETERRRLEVEKLRAEQSASTMKAILIALGAATGLGLLGFIAFKGR